MTPSILPQYSKVSYQLDPQTTYYTQKGIGRHKTPLNRVPTHLRIAPAGAENVKVNAARVIVSKERNKRNYVFITGIQETLFEGWYLGNDYEFVHGAKVRSLMLFHFQENDTLLDVYYFYRYDKQNTHYRMQFASETIPMLLAGAA